KWNESPPQKLAKQADAPFGVLRERSPDDQTALRAGEPVDGGLQRSRAELVADDHIGFEPIQSDHGVIGKVDVDFIAETVRMLARSPESERSLGFDGETVTPNVPGPFGWHRDRLEHAKAAEFVAESLEPRE